MSEAWYPKDPNEVKKYRYDWTGYLGTADISNSVAVVDAGTIAISAQSNDLKFSNVTLTGGVNGELAVVRITITTNGAETLEASVAIPIIDTYAAPSFTPYTIPTATQLLSTFPEFNSVANIFFWIDRAARNVDESWAEKDFQAAIMFYAAHQMALLGLGSGPDSLANSGQTAQFSEIRSGQLTLKRKTTAETAGADGSLLTSTIYGRMYRQLLLQNRPRTITAAATPVGDVGIYGDGYGYQWTV